MKLTLLAPIEFEVDEEHLAGSLDSVLHALTEGTSAAPVTVRPVLLVPTPGPLRHVLGVDRLRLTPHEAACVLDVRWGQRRYVSGSKRALIEAAFALDITNQVQLRLGFADVVDAVWVWQHVSHGDKLLEGAAALAGRTVALADRAGVGS